MPCPNSARERSVTIGFRVTPEQARRIDLMARASGMTKQDRQELQRRLTAKGFDTEGSDGVIGAKTRAAISAYQASVGLPVTGEPTLELLRRLR